MAKHRASQSNEERPVGNEDVQQIEQEIQDSDPVRRFYSVLVPQYEEPKAYVARYWNFVKNKMVIDGSVGVW